MTEGITAHVVQALVETGYTSNEKAMDAAVARITRVFIFPKVKRDRFKKRRSHRYQSHGDASHGKGQDDMPWRISAGGMSNKLAGDSSVGLCGGMVGCIQGKLWWRAPLRVS
jgi:hypothetical protein